MILEKEDTETNVLNQFFQKELKSLVQSIDTDHHYPETLLRLLGKEGYFNSNLYTDREVLLREFRLVEEVSQICMTTGFLLWCQLTAQTYLRQCKNNYLKTQILPQLENGKILGGTGLSNPMKFYGEMERLHLKAERADGGFIISGHLPSVSSLGENNWFGLVASLDNNQRIMAFIPCNLEGLSLKKKSDYLGINGSATYVCRFDQCFVSDDLIVSEHADSFIKKVRPLFLLYQIPLGLGVTTASIQSIRKVRKKQNGCNDYLPVQPEELEVRYQDQRKQIYDYLKSHYDSLDWNTLVQHRLDVTYLTLRSVETSMLHNGGAGYLYKSHPARRLREAYFLVNLTPTVKQLEKILA